MSAPSLKGQSWLEADASKAVMAALEAAGGPDCARYVGGCVRNALLDVPVDDVDIATQLEPQQVLAALKTAKIRAVPTGIEHGTITAVVNSQPFEITSLRRDVETDGRRAVVAFTRDWAEDAARRDFRLNALYANGRGELFDPTGSGLSDAEQRRIVFVGEPEQRIREDYLRILRFYRFWAWYGRGAVDVEGHAACRKLAEGVATLSAERVSKELLKLLAAPDPVAAVNAMDDAGVLSVILPRLDRASFAAMVAITPDPVLRLVALLPLSAEGLAEDARRLRLSNDKRYRMVESAVLLDADMSEQQARAMVWRDGLTAFGDRTYRAEAAGIAPQNMQALRQMAQDWAMPSMPVGGRDLAQAGFKPGPMTGKILKAFEQSWIAADFPADGHAARLQAAIDRVQAHENG